MSRDGLRPSFMLDPQTSREHAEREARITEFNTPRPGQKWAPADFVGDLVEPRPFVACNWQEGDPF